MLKYFDILYDEETKKDSLELKQINDFLNGKIVSEEHYFGQKYKFEEKKWKYDSLGRTVSLVSKEFYSSGNEKPKSENNNNLSVIQCQRRNFRFLSFQQNTARGI